MYGLINTGLRELIGIQTGERRTKRARLSRRFRQRIFWRDGGKCVWCDRPIKFEDATMDHVTPLVKRGRARLKENIVLACQNCNKKKGPLTQEIPDADLTPESLWMKFDKVIKDTQNRKGHYQEWVTTLDSAKA